MIENLKTKLTGTQITIGIVIAIVLCLVTGLILFRSVDRFKFTGPGYYPVDSMTYEIKKGDTADLESGENYATLTLPNGETCAGTENAVYYTDRLAAVLLCPWELVAAPENDEAAGYRVNCFTEIEKSGRNVIVTSGENKNIAAGALLFNGKDTYIVLQNARLITRDLEMDLPPLSYVIVNRGNWLQVRNHDTDEYKIHEIDVTDEVLIELEESGITVYAESDRMMHDGYEDMLISELSFLNEFGAK